MKLPEIKAKSREVVSNLTGLSHSRGPNCKNRICCLHICTYVLTSVCPVCVGDSRLMKFCPLCCGILGGVCLLVRREWKSMQCLVFFVRVRRLVLQVWTRCKPSRANSDTAVAIHPQHLLGILSMDYEQRWKKTRGKNCMESSWGGVCGFLSSFGKKRKKPKKVLIVQIEVSGVCISVSAGSLACASNLFQDGVKEFTTYMWYLARIC